MARQERNSVLEASEAVVQALALNDVDRAYRAVLQLSNDLASAPTDALPSLAVRPPEFLPSGWDAFLAAVVEWRLLQAGVEPPRWVLTTVGSSSSWAPPGAVLAPRTEHVPWSFSRRNVYIEEGELDSA